MDLAVPSRIPVAALLPALLRHTEATAADGGAPHAGWMLRKVDGTPLDSAVSLEAAGVTDGALLMLQIRQEPTPTPLYDDVVEVLARGARAGRWQSRHTREVCGVVGSIAVTAAAVALMLAGSGRTYAAVALGAAALLMLSGAAMSRAAGDAVAGTLVAALSLPYAVLGSTWMLGGDWGRPHLLLACAAVAVVAALMPPLVGTGEAVAAAYASAAVTGAVGAVIAVGWDESAARSAAIAGPVALAVTTVLPTLALRLARMPRPELASTVDRLGEVAGSIDLDATGRRITAARRILTGLSTGCCAVAAAAAAVLGTGTSRWEWGLAAVIGVLLLARARLFGSRSQVLVPVAVAGLLAVLMASILLWRYAGDASRLRTWALPITGGAAVLALIIGGSAGRRTASPRTHRIADAVEILLQVGVAPLVLGVWGVYARIKNL